MCFSSEELQSFLVGRWSVPLRLACPSFAPQTQRALALARQKGARKPPRVPAPRWMTAQYLFRWLGQAFVVRAEREKRQGGAPRYEYGRRSEPCWSQTITVPYAPGYLRQQPIEAQWFLSMNIERLYRMTQTPTEEIGTDLWGQAVLGVCQHLAQGYAALRRRYKAKQAREIVEGMLRRFSSQT